jgi:hypothetical protein
LTPTARQRFFFEFLPMVQDAFPSATLYIIWRDFAKGLVIPHGVARAEECGEHPLRDTNYFSCLAMTDRGQT